MPLSLSHKQAISTGRAKQEQNKGVPLTTEQKKKISDALKLFVKPFVKPLATVLRITKSRKATMKNKPVNPNHPRGHCNCPCGCAAATTSAKWYGGKGVRQQCSACYCSARRQAAAGCTCVKL